MSTIWAFDLGKGSIGEAVWSKPHGDMPGKFLVKRSAIVDADLARRGPTFKQGTPANKYRAMKTRLAHKSREAWLELLWDHMGLKRLFRPAFELMNWRMSERTISRNGKKKKIRRQVGGEWIARGTSNHVFGAEYSSSDDSGPWPSSAARIKLLLGLGNQLDEESIYKALFAAIQKRGQGQVPWQKKEKKVTSGAAPDDAKAFEQAGQRWTDFCGKAPTKYHYPCYFDAYHSRLWNWLSPNEVHRKPVERPESTQNVVFPLSAVTKEVLAIAKAVEVLYPEKTEHAYETAMAGWHEEVKRRIEAINKGRVRRGKLEISTPDFSRKATSFAELIAFGPGGMPLTSEHVRIIPSYDPQTRKSVGLRPGSPDDKMGSLGQTVARFDNRLTSPCAVIPRLQCCRNRSPADLKPGIPSNHEDLLAAQVVFLLQLKNQRVEEKDGNKIQRKLLPEEVREIFEQRDALRVYSLTPGQWRKFCNSKRLLPIVQNISKDATEKEGNAEDDSNASASNKDYIITPASTEGRCGFSRPGLIILKELILGGKSPDEFHKLLLNGEIQIGTMAGYGDQMKAKHLQITAATGDPKMDQDAQKRGLLTTDLLFLKRMCDKQGKPVRWEDLFVPTQSPDTKAVEHGYDNNERMKAIGQLIGQQRNPVVRHRLSWFLERLKLHASQHGEPETVVIELARGNSDNSWLGDGAKKHIRSAQDRQEKLRSDAKQLLKDAGMEHVSLRKAMLWLDQGGHCLYGKEQFGTDGASKAKCVYLETALPLSGLDSYRIDHIIPRARGGPDAYYNVILTTDDANGRKGDRTPWEWFKQDRPDEWDSYRQRVAGLEGKIGRKKARLLVSADSAGMVESYNPLAETGWIARLAQIITSLYFGWSNGIDSKGKRRVLLVSGGVTGRQRRRYYLNTLTGPDSLKPLPADKDEREKVEQSSEEDRNNKDRRDLRHHALDAMILCFMAQWVNDPQREDEFRFTDLGDTPCYTQENKGKAAALRDKILNLQKAVEAAETKAQREAGHREITRLRDALWAMRQKRDWRRVREFFQREMDGDEDSGIAPVLPIKRGKMPELLGSRYRRSWQRVEKKDVPNVGPLEIDKTLSTDKMPLADLPYWRDEPDAARQYLPELGLLRSRTLRKSSLYDRDVIRSSVVAFLEANPSSEEWDAFATQTASQHLVPAGKKTQKETPVEVDAFEDRCTKRGLIAELGMSSRDEDMFSTEAFEQRLKDVVKPITGDEVKAGKTLEDDLKMQARLRAFLPHAQKHFLQYPPSTGQKLRQDSAKQAEKKRKDDAKKEWEALIKEHGFTGKKEIALRELADEAEKRPYYLQQLHQIFLIKAKRFSEEALLKEVKSIADPWLRWQLRGFASSHPTSAEWREFCGCLVQVKRDDVQRFLTSGSTSARDWIEFYRQQRESSRRGGQGGHGYRSIIKHVQMFDGFGSAYVSVSKDGSGIYAKGGNQGYLLYQVSKKGEAGKEKTVTHARAVRVFESVHRVRSEVFSIPGVRVPDKKLWANGDLLYVPQDTKSASKTVPRGYYLLGSISGGQYCEIRPMRGGDVLSGISIHALVDGGMTRIQP